MKRVITIAALVALFNPIAAHAYPTEVKVTKLQRLARIEEFRAEARERWQARLAALEADAAQTVEETADVVVSGIAGIIANIFGVHADQAIAVASCESGLNPNAVNGQSGAAGLFQLMSFHWEGKFDPFDPVANTRYAFGLSAGGTDWSAWSGGACA